MRFKDKVVLVTGASTGIGRSTAIEFAKEGAIVVVNSFSHVEKGQAVVKEIEQLGSKSLLIKCDVSNGIQVKNMIGSIINKFGRIDILINNAGFVKDGELFSLSLEDFKKTLDVNLLGVFLCMKYAAKEMMKRKKGKIVNVSSIRGLENCARKDIIDYSAAKAGVINLTKSLAKELTPKGINVNCVAPGITNTDIIKGLTGEARRKAIDRTLLKRMAEPIEIAKAILFLASDDASYITGECLVVDGVIILKSFKKQLENNLKD